MIPKESALRGEDGSKSAFAPGVWENTVSFLSFGQKLMKMAARLPEVQPAVISVILTNDQKYLFVPHLFDSDRILPDQEQVSRILNASLRGEHKT